MKIAIMQPYFFPYIGYWQLVNAVDKFVIYDDVNYIKRGWISKNKILLNENEKSINIQIKDASQNKLINETFVHFDAKNRYSLVKTIEHAYAKAPYFNTFSSLLKNLILDEEERLDLYLEKQIREIAAYAGINTEIMSSSELMIEKGLKGQYRIIKICEKLGATEYLNPIGGIDLYDNSVFEIAGVHLGFLSPIAVKYNQFGQNFVPYLSIIDVLMFNSPEHLFKLLQAYEIIEKRNEK